MGDSLLMKSENIFGRWKEDFIEKNTPVFPISGWVGEVRERGVVGVFVDAVTSDYSPT